MRNIAFIIIVAVALFSVMGNAAASLVVPGYDMPERSYLEGRVYQKAPDLNADSLARGTFQSEAEQCVADAVPGRDAVLLANAALQRRSIEAAASSLGITVYPTFYGSDYLYCAGESRLVEMPLSKRDLEADAPQRAAAVVGGLAERHPGASWRMALVDRSNISLSSPAHGLVGDAADYAYWADGLAGRLPESCPFVDLSARDAGEWGEWYFESDHHGRVQGTVAAYRRVMESLGKDPVEFGGLRVVYPGPFYGSEARGGLMTDVSDVLYDIDYSHGDYRVTVGEKSYPASYLDSGFGGEEYAKSSEFANVYAEYFHGDPPLITIENDAAPEGTLLIIGDSFTNNMERFFAESYRTVYVIDPRYFTDSIDAFIDSHEADDAVVLLSTNTLANQTVQQALSG